MIAKGIGPRYRQKLAKVVNASRSGITPETVSRTLGVTPQEAGRLLSRWARAGWLQRIKRGFYVSIPVEGEPGVLAIENPSVVVSKIYSPGYLGGFSAIKHWNLSEQIFETIMFFTTKKIKERHPHLSNIKVQLKTIKSAKLFGTKPFWVESTKIQISDPSKTIVDLFDDPQIVGGMTVVRDVFEQYLESEHKNIHLLLDYAKRIGNRAVFKRLGFLLEIVRPMEVDALLFARKNISKGYSKFDPMIDNDKFIRSWNLSVPRSWMKEYGRKS